MKINRISISNFKAIHRREEILGEGIIGLTGANGRGKSTFANAIAWTFFGPEAIPTGKADLVSWGAKEARVEVDFELAGVEYSIVRWQKENGEGNASLHRGETELASGLDPTPREVTALLGVDRVGFLISVFSRQEELSGLSSLTPANRMKTVLRLLGVEELTQAIEATRSDARVSKKTLESLRENAIDHEKLSREIDRCEHLIIENRQEELALSGAYSKQESKLSEIRKRLKSSDADLQEWEAYQSAVSEAKMRVAAAEGALVAAVRAASAPPPPAPGPEPPEPESGLLDDLMAERRYLTESISRLDAELKSVSTYCPYCKRAYENEEEINQHREEAEQARDQHRAKLPRINEDINKERETITVYQKWLDRSRLSEEWQRGQDQRYGAVFAAQDMMRSTQSALNAILPPIDPRDERSVLQEQEYSVVGDLAEIKTHLAVTQAQIKSAKEQLVLYQREVETAAKRAEQVDTLQRRTVHTEVTSRELSALKERIIGTAIPVLNDTSSRILSEMTKGEFNEIALTPDYEIRYRNEVGELKGFAHLSGGEKDVFALALRLAIADLRADRLGVLFLDEVLESLDDERQNTVWDALANLTKRYQQIFVVTHVDKFKDRAPLTLQF